MKNGERTHKARREADHSRPNPRATTHPEKTRRHEEALVRQAERNERSDQEQLDRLIAGGHGHCEEATRLRIRIRRATIPATDAKRVHPKTSEVADKS